MKRKGKYATVCERNHIIFRPRSPDEINLPWIHVGGVPLALDGLLVGGVGVAGLPEGVDEKSAEAGIEAWMKFRGTMKK
jgi:uncharacterized protein GlcG (DUF336 family)